MIPHPSSDEPLVGDAGLDREHPARGTRISSAYVAAAAGRGDLLAVRAVGDVRLGPAEVGALVGPAGAHQ